MGDPRPFEPEKLVVGVLASRGALSRPGWWQRVRERLEGTFGPIDYASRELPFGFTRYYDEELGTPLVRLFVAFRTLVDPQNLARIKLATNALEDEFRAEGPGGPRTPPGAHRSGPTTPRTVNLDPGLVSLGRFILASTKNASHRVPLAHGIFAEITLQYRRPCFRPVPWTYPDYSSDEVREVLLEIRELLKVRPRVQGSAAPPGPETCPPAPNEPPRR